MRRYKIRIEKDMWRHLTAAYAEIDRTDDQYDGPLHRAIGEYEGLRRAYCIITGLDEAEVANKVVSWYINSEHYTSSAS